MKGVTFLLTAVAVAAVDVLVPYLLLARTGSFLASFLFWCVLTLAVIVAAGIHTRRWKEQ